MSTDAQATAQRLAALPPNEAAAAFAAMSTEDKCNTLVAAGRLGFAEWMSLRGRVPTTVLKGLWPACSKLSDADWYAAYFTRRLRLRHAFNGEIEWSDTAIRRTGGVVVVAVHRVDDGSFLRTPLYVAPQFASAMIDGRYELSEAEIESAVASAGVDGSGSSIPGARVIDGARAVR